MKKVTFLFLAFLFLSFVQAQKVYFIYLQSENQQPFYTRTGEKIQNSTPSGYLVLSNLRDSTYTINIGAQGKEAPDQPYSLTVNKKDQGYLFKNFGDKGWGLFNLQSLAIVMPAVNKTVSTVKTEKIEGNEFTNLLIKASDDSTLKERPVLAKAEEKPPADKQAKPAETVVAENKETTPNEQKEGQQKKETEIKTESIPSVTAEKNVIKPTSDNKLNPAVGITGIAVISNKEEKADTINTKKEVVISVNDTLKTVENKPITETGTQSADSSEKYIKSTVSLHSESSTSLGVGLIFLDAFSNGVTDTIKIFIPAETKKEIQVAANPEQKEYLNPIPVDSVKQTIPQPSVSKNNNCVQQANEDDFFKLRKKMAGESADDGMIAEAKKVFKTKCFSTKQIKNLGSLFLTDEGRYKFFDAAYIHVSDIGEFPALQSELKEEYYINRFKAMLRQ